MEDLSVFVRYYPDKNFESQLSADQKILVKVRALQMNRQIIVQYSKKTGTDKKVAS